jgi:hypothetical protein
MDLIIAALAILCVIAIPLIVQLRGRDKRDSAKAAADPSNRNRFDTTLGELHDIREALRPHQHTRAASRRVPAHRE